MVLFGIFKKKTKPILNEEDSSELKEIQRLAYMTEARELMKKRGIEMAKRELEIKKPKDNF